MDSVARSGIGQKAVLVGREGARVVHVANDGNPLVSRDYGAVVQSLQDAKIARRPRRGALFRTLGSRAHVPGDCQERRAHLAWFNGGDRALPADGAQMGRTWNAHCSELRPPSVSERLRSKERRQPVGGKAERISVSVEPEPLNVSRYCS